jgi:cell division septum initiation protein DivIVA
MSEERETYTATPALDLDAIEARANAATPGPWVQSQRDMWMVYRDGGGTPEIDVGGGYDIKENAAFVAHARSDVPALVAEVRNLRAYVAALDSEIKVFYGEPVNTAQRSPEATIAVLVQELEECVSAFCASKVLNRAVPSAANEMQCARARLLRRGWALESENIKLRADLERIGRERDDMARANAELQARLSAYERSKDELPTPQVPPPGYAWRSHEDDLK